MDRNNNKIDPPDSPRCRLMTIGAFSSASHLSQKALRLYEKHGLLRPTYIDPTSGYRYYRADQLPTARLIYLMRSMDMPMAKIGRMLKATPTEAGDMMRTYWQGLEERLARHRRVQDVLLPLLYNTHCSKGNTMSSELTLTTEEIKPQLVLSITKRVKIDGLGDHLKGSQARLLTFAEAATEGKVAGKAFGIFHGPVNHDDDGPMEVCLPVQGAFVPTGDIVLRELPGGPIVRVVGTGEYCEFPKVLEMYDSAARWINTNGYQMDGSPRELWSGPNGEEDAMQVVWLYKK